MDGRESGIGNRESLKRKSAFTAPDSLLPVFVPCAEQTAAAFLTIPDSRFPIPAS